MIFLIFANNFRTTLLNVFLTMLKKVLRCLYISLFYFLTFNKTIFFKNSNT